MSDTRVGRSSTSNLTLLEKDQLDTAVSSLDGKADKQLGGRLNIGARLLTHFTTRDESITQDIAAAKKALEEAKGDGRITAEEADLVEAKVREAEREISGFSSFKRNVADVAAVGVTVGAAALGTVVSGPVGGAIAASAVGSALNVGTHMALQGRSYSWENLGVDAVTGAVYTGLLAKLGTASFVKAVLPSVLARTSAAAVVSAGVTTGTDASIDSLGWSIAEPAKEQAAAIPRQDAPPKV